VRSCGWVGRFAPGAEARVCGVSARAKVGTLAYLEERVLGAGWVRMVSPSCASLGRSGGWGKRAVGVVEKQIPPLCCGSTRPIRGGWDWNFGLEGIWILGHSGLLRGPSTSSDAKCRVRLRSG
jgi:hypothetical protein